jgi:hypothetical protein
MTILALGVAFAVALGAGMLLVPLAWPRSVAPCPWPLAAALGVGAGAGLSAILFFLYMIAFGPTRWLPLAEGGLLAVLVALSLRHRRAQAPIQSGAGRASPPSLLLLVAFGVTLVAAVGAFASILHQHPHGQWDAWMNWDLRARMIVRGGEAWRAAFSGLFPWSHPDYPILVPSLVSRSWIYAGTETMLGPALVAFTFTFGTIALLVTAIAALRNTNQGLLAGLVLLSTPFFIVHGTSLYADVPLGFFFLATMVCLALDGRYAGATGRFALLAGTAAGLAMWTKNEGTLFTLAVGGGLIFVSATGARSVSGSRLRAFAVGLLPMILLVAGFKIALAPPNDLLSTLGVERTMGRLTDPARYALVLREYVRHTMTFGDNGFGSVVWLLTAYSLGVGSSRLEAARPWAKGAVIAIALLLAGHFLVFVSMADELARLLDSSLDRLLLQLWPSALFVVFMLLRTPEEVGASLTTERLADDR